MILIITQQRYDTKVMDTSLYDHFPTKSSSWGGYSRVIPTKSSCLSWIWKDVHWTYRHLWFAVSTFILLFLTPRRSWKSNRW